MERSIRELTVGDIFQVCFRDVRDGVRRNGQPWISFMLNLNPRIKIQPLSETWVCSKGHTHEAKQASVPFLWALKDEELLTTENKRIAFVKDMSYHLVKAHELLLEEYFIDKDEIVVSEGYRMEIGPTFVTPLGYGFKSYTAFATCPDVEKL